MSISSACTARAGTLLFTILLGAVTIRAATAHRFAIASEGSYPVERRGRLVSDGNRWRIDYDQSNGVRPHDSVIGGSSDRRIALNHSNKTWYYLDPAEPTVVLASLLDFYRVSPPKATKFSLDETDRVISFKYGTVSRMGTESLRGDFSGRIVVSASGSPLPSGARDLLYPLPRTGIADVDRKLQDALAHVMANAGSTEITLARQFKGGESMTQVIRANIAEAEQTATASDSFRVPDGYQYQLPVIGTPGVQAPTNR
jgi:hypothetical protein